MCVCVCVCVCVCMCVCEWAWSCLHVCLFVSALVFVNCIRFAPNVRASMTQGFFKCAYKALGRCPETPGSSKNVSGPINISLRKCLRCKAIYVAPPSRGRDLGDNPLRL